MIIVESLPSDRRTAEVLSLPYFRGNPCARFGHVVRLTNRGLCLLCSRKACSQAARRMHDKDPDKARARYRAKAARWRERQEEPTNVVARARILGRFAALAGLPGGAPTAKLAALIPEARRFLSDVELVGALAQVLTAESNDATVFDPF